MDPEFIGSDRVEVTGQDTLWEEHKPETTTQPRLASRYVTSITIKGHGAAERTLLDEDTGQQFFDM